MTMKLFCGALVALTLASTCLAQGLTDPYRYYSPRLGDPSRLSFSGRNDFDRNLNFRGDRRYDPNPPRLMGVFPDRVFNLDDLALRQNRIGGGGGNFIGNRRGIASFGRNQTTVGDFLIPTDLRRSGNFAANATAVGNRSAGIGTGVGNKFAGLGAYHYGQGAGLGMFASGLGDYMAGQGRLLEGQGTYEQLNSVANINNEEAQYRKTKNEEYHAAAFFNKRKTNIEGRRYEEEMKRYAVNRLSNEQIAKLQQDRAPDRLSFQQYDEVTGALAWPTLLRNPYFTEARQEINRLFAMRTELGANTGLGSDNYREIRRRTQQLEYDLRETMPEMTPMEYTMAKNFLRSLEYEAQHPMATGFPVARVADAR